MAIVVSHIDSDFDALCARALRQQPLSDLIELRLDRSGHPGKERLRAFCKQAKKPVIVACHGREAFGERERDPGERCELLHDAAEAGARFVDVDWSLALELGEVRAPCHRIVSRHVLDGTPEDLAALHEEVQAVLGEGDVTKLVTHARSCEDGMRLLAWLATTKGVIAFCSGAAGSFTRVLAPIFGSPFTYCASALLPGEPAGEATAPGQWRVNDFLAALPPGGISQETAIFGVVGRPIGHSLSPRVQGMAFKAAKLDALYVAFEPTELESFLALAHAPNFRGFSVTAPFKQDALRLSVLHDEASRRAGAVNTLLRDRAGWKGANTDVPAVRETLTQAFHLHARAGGRPARIAGAQVLVLGAGGAARAVVHAARSLDARVSVAARDYSCARELAEELSCAALEWSAIPTHAHDVLVNTTPVGSAASGVDATPIPPEWLRPGTLVLDAVYRPIRTALLAAAHARGCTPVPGGEWFVRQAALQFRLFTQQEPDLALLRHAFEHALTGAARS
ncbi:MAG: type I 3-dehydroquinate dehydratase [Planctomycetes bacterium]|nr:type I 3-dehydroquinate dehydratase [Planctomycetota bacterium]